MDSNKAWISNKQQQPKVLNLFINIQLATKEGILRFT